MSAYKDQAYRQASAEGATHVGLLLVVYDALASDLREAGRCSDAGKIAGRCTSSNHGLALLGHLESWTEFLDDRALAVNLKHFYGYLRGEILKLQAKGCRSDFEMLSELVLNVRAAWQEKEEAASGRKPANSALRGSLEVGARRPTQWCA